MVFPVTDDDVLGGQHTGNGPQISGEPGGVDHRLFLTDKSGQSILQGFMQGQVAAQESGSPGATTPPTCSLARCLNYSGIVSKSQVVVGPNHNQTPARNLHCRAPRSVYGPEVRVKPLFPGVLDHKSKRLAAVSKFHKRILPPPPPVGLHLFISILRKCQWDLYCS